MKFEIKTDLGYHLLFVEDITVPKKGDTITYKNEDYIVKSICHNYDSGITQVFVSSFESEVEFINNSVAMMEEFRDQNNIFKTIKDFFKTKK